ncbi:MAG: MBL fold metallo-hydrolase [Vicinamibacterales bacterium]|nr:MBL fold metallo-hydrolase [Vicinamibacterales bacterium]
MSIVLALLLLTLADARSQSQSSVSSRDPAMRVILLGTAAGPTFDAQRLGISTLVEAGSERLLFDAGRSLTTGMARMAINPSDVTKVFLTHLHSDHIISLPELYLFPWASQGRNVPLQVWGPNGTRRMFAHLQEAFAFDIRIRRDVDEKFSPDGIRVIATDIREGSVYESNGIRVTAFLVDHSPVTPAFGYRIDYQGRSIAISGDTKPSDNLVKFASGVDLLIHEVARPKQDPAFIGPPDELLPNSRQTRGRAKIIAEHHTDGVEAGRVFQRVKPKLALFSHFNVDPSATLRLVRQNYEGPVEFGEDLMTIDVGSAVSIRRFGTPNR